MIEAESGEAGGRSYGAPAYRSYVLILLMLVYALNFVDRVLLSVIAQPVIDAFQLSDSQFGFLNGPPFAIFYALMGIPIAAAADRYNRVIIISICIAMWSLMAALCGVATSFLFLLFARIGVAIGEAGCTPPANSIIGDYFKPKSRAAALGIYAMGVTIGSAVSNAFGGPIAGSLNGTVLLEFFQAHSWLWAIDLLDWRQVEGWRLAFIVIGAPGLLLALIVLLTVKEPPRGVSDPTGASAAKSSFAEVVREVSRKPTFWTMSVGAALTALVAYGLLGFQAPMAQRVHGMPPGTFALEFGVPLALSAALGTFLGGYLIERLTPRVPGAVSYVPAAGLLLCIPFYESAFFLPSDQLELARFIWCIGAALHYSFLGSQYTIAQGVVPSRARASAVALMLLIVALIGNGLGPPIVGWLSDMFMSMQLAEQGMGGVLSNAICRARDLSALPAAQQAICTAAYGEGLRWAMAATTLIFAPASAFFFASGLTLKNDLVAKPI